MRIRLLTFVLGLATLIGGAASAVSFLPRPSVTASDPVDLNDPFSATFTVSNNNYIPLDDLSVGISPVLIDMGEARLVSDGPVEDAGVIFHSAWRHHRLAMDEKFTLALSQIYGPDAVIAFPRDSKLQSANIAVVVNYKPWFVPLQRSRRFRFVAYRERNGRFYWHAAPLS